MNTYYITQKKLEELKREHNTIKAALQEEVAAGIPNLLEGSDPNPDFYLFEENIEDLNAREEVLENIIKNYKIIESPPKTERDKVQLGASVVCKNSEAGEFEYNIVGTIEANPFEGKISNESPVGMALIGKRVGDVITIPQMQKNYQILKIEYKDA